MDKNELRIGNWVEVKQAEKGFYTTIQPSCFSVDIDKTYKAIPLDEEWLLTFGFKKISGINDRYLKDYGAFFFSLLLTNDGKSYHVTLSNHDGNEAPPTIGFGIFKYVHQLQNIYFALCSDELVYNLQL